MQFITDLHIHSKYSRACSKSLNIENIDKWCKIKGIQLIGTGDFTHPAWMQELKTKLKIQSNGLYVSNNTSQNDPIYFVPTVEISCIYRRYNQTRRVHLIIVVKNLEIAEEINTRLSKLGKLASDGRPILGLDSEELAKIVIDASLESIIIPAHIWTPWFSLYGSNSGFNSIEECFGEMSKYIYAVETGLSSNPPMNWMVSDLDNVLIISNSDAHSLEKLGREASIFEGLELSYSALFEAFSKRNLSRDSKLKLVSTIEFFPEEGKYYHDGHLNCKVSLAPTQENAHKICPVCHKKLTVGVLSRANDLANRTWGEKSPLALPYKNIIPLIEIISEALGVGVQSKSCRSLYFDLVSRFGSEFNILLNLSLDLLSDSSLVNIKEGVRKVRSGEVSIEPGHDGVFGKINLNINPKNYKQASLMV